MSTPTAESPTDEAKALRAQRASAIVKDHVLWGIGAGLIPIPIADIFALTTVQMKMLAELADLYAVPYTQEGSRAILAALIGSSASSLLARGTGSAIKSIPIVGQTAGTAAMSIYGGAMTYAVGEVFIRHFESGGTLLDFDAAHSKTYLTDMYNKGLTRIEDWRRGTPAADAKGSGQQG